MPTINYKNLLGLGDIKIDVEDIRDEIKRDLMFELDKRFDPIKYGIAYILDTILELHPTKFNTDKGVYDALPPEEREKYLKKVQREVNKLRDLTDALNKSNFIGHCSCCTCKKYYKLERIAQEVII